MTLLSTLKSYPLEYLLPFLLPVFFQSYIHPDEHFQSLEPLTSKVLGFTAQLPWEYTCDKPARSYGVLYLYYGPLLLLIRTTNPALSPIYILYLVRVQNLLVSSGVILWTLSKLIYLKKQYHHALHFVVTSYIYGVYQTHTFSNSIETCMVLLALASIENLNSHYNLICLGVLFAIGIFNRVTFIAWLLAPSWYILRHLVHHKLNAIPLAFGFGITALVLILIDSISFAQSWSLFQLVITPWNNLIYNSLLENLAQHGIHPWYTHLLINTPQILGPGLLMLLIRGVPWSRISILPFLSIVSGVALLSFIPHQELRFLAPMLPLACTILNYEEEEEEEEEEETANIKSSIVSLIGILWGVISAVLVTTLWYAHRPSAPFIWYIFGGTYFTTTELFNTSQDTTTSNPFYRTKFRSFYGWLFLRIWIFFNLTMNVLMGVYHQGGVVSVLNKFHMEQLHSKDNVAIIFWRTYSPPTWVLGDTTHSIEAFTMNETSLVYEVDRSKSNLLDFMGADVGKVCASIEQLSYMNKQVYMVLPTGSFPTVALSCDYINWQRLEDFHYQYHYDLDHLDFSDLRTFTPGLDVYKFNYILHQ